MQLTADMIEANFHLINYWLQSLIRQPATRSFWRLLPVPLLLCEHTQRGEMKKCYPLS